jgi:hypothetical protein
MEWKLHRSRILWAGIVVMISVGWGWRDSKRNFALLNCEGYAAISVGSGLSFARVGRKGIRFDQAPIGGEISSLSEVGIHRPVFMRNDGEGWEGRVRTEVEAGTDPLGPLAYVLWRAPGNWLVYVPYWLVLVAVALCCGLGLGWRARAIRRSKAVMQREAAAA